MRFDILTLFPRSFDIYPTESILGRAQRSDLIRIVAHQLRDWSTDPKHARVDDTPYGGGAGMVLQVEPIWRAVNDLKKAHGDSKDVTAEVVKKTRTILFSAKGKRFTQDDARRLSEYDQLILICGRYEGVDERVAEHIADEELSIGDFVLTGGELPAMVVIDAVARLLPDVLGNSESAITESHSEAIGQLEHPQYTKPEEFNGWRVPEVLLSGHHEHIRRWRDEHSAV